MANLFYSPNFKKENKTSRGTENKSYYIFYLLTKLAMVAICDLNLSCLIAVIGSVGLRDYWEAASIVFLFTIAQWLEARASHKVS